MTDASYWALRYLGQPWRAGAKGPDAWYCWSLFRHVQRAYYGVDVPEIGETDGSSLLATARAFNTHPERSRWTEITLPNRPNDGDAVLMSSNQMPVHIGVWLPIDGGVVFHCTEKSGVVATPPDLLRFNGFRILGYFRSKGLS